MASMQDEIRLVAYFNWINRGRPHGDPLADWAAAYDAVIHGDRTRLAPPTPPREARKQLVLKFFQLGRATRHKAVVDAGVWEPEDDVFDGQEKWARVFARAAATGRLATLWNAMAAQDEALARQQNPFLA
jgi:hypothetical protein